ncbi:MAG: polyprenyl synthetase family protein [Raineya sp.]|nr:polyprenyl synthetase family protein [Raineya sp.]
MNLKPYLQEIENFLATHHFGNSPVELYEPIDYMMNLGGKRLRPILVLLGYEIFEKNWQKAVQASIAVEVFHNFTLMHDDIMDKAPLRRNHATVHTKWNENIAILSGDVMLVKAYEILLQGVEDKFLRQALQKFNRCATWVCEGQQWDMNFETQSQVTIAEYLEMIRLKTAVLLGFALELGAMLAGADESEQEKLRLIGENMGIGFQLKDDLLDVFGNPEKFGKQVGGDIIANKKTYLLIEALQTAQNETRNELLYWLSLKEFDPQAKVKAVTQIYENLRIKEKTEQLIASYFQKAFEHLSEIQVPASAKENLHNFMTWLIERES